MFRLFCENWIEKHNSSYLKSTHKRYLAVRTDRDTDELGEEVEKLNRLHTLLVEVYIFLCAFLHYVIACSK